MIYTHPSHNPQHFDISIKAFLINRGKILMVQESVGHKWELPGGRINLGEELIPHEEILRRELHEELGDRIVFDILRPMVTSIRPYTGSRSGQFCCLIGYLCHYQGGGVTLSREHQAFRWLNETEITQLDFLPGYEETLPRFWKLYKQQK